LLLRQQNLLEPGKKFLVHSTTAVRIEQRKRARYSCGGPPRLKKLLNKKPIGTDKTPAAISRM